MPAAKYATDEERQEAYRRNAYASHEAQRVKKEQEKAQALLDLAQTDPEAVRSLLEELSKKVLIPHSPGQSEVLMSEARFKILCAGRRWGKTKVGAARALREARTKPGSIVWWIAPIYRNVKRGYQEVLAQLPDGVLTHAPPPESAFDAGRPVVLRFKNGSKMEFYSADRPEGMLGGSCDFVILDEAATMNESVWFQIVQPTLADRQGGALFISTPRGKNWFYRLWVQGQDDLVADFQSWRFPSFTNPTIPESEWERQKEILPAAIYEQEVLADFISASANVFRFNDDSVKPMAEPEGHVTIGIDLAKYNDFTVIIGVRTGDRRVCYHDRFNSVSWPEQRRRIQAAVEEIEKTATGVTVLMDSTGLGDVVYDDLSEEGLDAIPVKFTQQWKQQAVMLLAADLERESAFLVEEQVREFESYTYVISETTGRWKFEAGTGHDDEVSAMLLAHWGVVNMGVPDVKMISVGGDAPQLPAGAQDDYDEAEIVEGEVVYEEIVTPNVLDLMNSPDVWG